jgi:hypothetical protein
MSKRKENYLDYIPVIRSEWDDGETVTVHMVHRGFYAWVAQKFFHRPRVSYIQLDDIGSFLFRHMDGQRTVGDLAELVKAEFGEKAEPLYDRLVQYLKILRNNGFIDYRTVG